MNAVSAGRGNGLWAVFALTGVLAATTMGCNQGTSIGARPTDQAAKAGSERTVTGNELIQKGGLCDENRRISKPDADRPEAVIWRLYEISLGPDTEANFQEFVKLFPSSRNVRELRELYWTRMRQTVHKFVVEAGKPDFVICRSIETSDGRKYYISSSDPRQTPPPITVGESDGRNKILFLTPF
jgi:hypothetical protein